MKKFLAAVAVCWALALGAGAARAQPQPEPQPPAKFGDGVPSKRAPIQAPKDRPAQGSPYNWRQMGYAAALIAITGIGLVVIIRRATRQKRA